MLRRRERRVWETRGPGKSNLGGAWAGHATVRCLCASAGGRTQLRLRGGR